MVKCRLRYLYFVKVFSKTILFKVLRTYKLNFCTVTVFYVHASLPLGVKAKNLFPLRWSTFLWVRPSIYPHTRPARNNTLKA